jgi:hypothetical protein
VQSEVILTTIIVFVTHDVVFSRVFARQPFDREKMYFFWIFGTKDMSQGNVCWLILSQKYFFIFLSVFGGTTDYHPVFGMVVVHLHRNLLAWLDHDALDLKAFALSEAFIPAPRW